MTANATLSVGARGAKRSPIFGPHTPAVIPCLHSPLHDVRYTRWGFLRMVRPSRVPAGFISLLGVLSTYGMLSPRGRAAQVKSVVPRAQGGIPGGLAQTACSIHGLWTGVPTCVADSGNLALECTVQARTCPRAGPILPKQEADFLPFPGAQTGTMRGSGQGGLHGTLGHGRVVAGGR